MTKATRFSAALLALAAAGAFAVPAHAEMVKYMAQLTGAAQVPPVDSAATGTADITVDTDAMKIMWKVTVDGLSGDPTAEHIHGPASETETAPPMIDMSENIMEGTADLTPEAWQAIQDGKTYVNVHTEKYPDGEIRGQVMAGDASTM